MLAPGSPQRAGEFDAPIQVLTSSTGTVQDIDKLLTHVTLFESIETSAISGNALLLDPINFSTNFPMIGQEYFSLKLRTKGGSFLGFNLGEIDFSENQFIVNKVVNRTDTAADMQMLAFDFTTSEVRKNNRRKLNFSFTGSYSETFTKIMRDVIGTKKRLTIEPTLGTKRIVFPNIRPFDAIHQMKRQAVNQRSGEATYMFYEDLASYNFRSLQSMNDSPAVCEYEFVEPITNPNQGMGLSKDSDLFDIQDFTLINPGDTLENEQRGTYASTLISYDTFAKKINNYTYNYIDKFFTESHMGDNDLEGRRPLVSETPIEGTQRISDFPTKTFLAATANKYVNGVDTGKNIAFPTCAGLYPFEAVKTENWLQRRRSQLAQLETGIKAQVRVFGNCGLRCGDKILLRIPSTNAADIQEEQGVDAFFTGEFLIRSIRHDFDFGTQTHMMILTVFKDTLGLGIKNLTDSLERSPATTGFTDVFNFDNINIEEE